jgi:SlyX protein
MMGTTDMNDDIIDLQTRVAFQDGLLEELNQVLTNQQQQITRLENAMGIMRSQIETMQSTQSEGETIEPPPPHY